MEFHLVDDDVPEISREILETACSERDISYIEHDSNYFVFRPEFRLEPGALLFRPAVSQTAIHVEQYMYTEGVSTFHRTPLDVYQGGSNYIQLFDALGIPTPRSFYLTTTYRDTLDYYVEQLGGYPVILKVQGYSGGLGVMRLDNRETFYSVAEYVCATGQQPLLAAYIDDAVHWRCLVLGDSVIAGYTNPLDENDFRTYGTTDANEVTATVEPEMERLAVRSAHAVGCELGGVDILRHSSGRYYVLECNFPCYYAHAQEHGGIDVAGQMVDYLVEKAARIAI